MSQPKSIFQKPTNQAPLSTTDEFIQSMKEKETKLESKIAQLQQVQDENEIDIKNLVKAVSDRDGMITTLRVNLDRVEIENKHLQNKYNTIEGQNRAIKKSLEEKVNESRVNNSNLDKLLSLLSPTAMNELEMLQKDFRLKFDAFMKKETEMKNIVQLFMEAYNWESKVSSNCVMTEQNLCNSDGKDNRNEVIANFEATPRRKGKPQNDH